MKNHLIILFLAVLLSGCASVSTPMKNAEGNVINCGASGFGLIGAPAALIMRDNCVSDAKEKGFAPLDEMPNATTVNSTNPYAGKITLSLPDGWVRKSPPQTYTNVIVFATNTTMDAYVLLSYEPKKNITDVRQYAETKKAAQLSKLSEASSTAMIRSEIHGHSSFSTDIVGILRPTSVKYHFITTVIDGDAEVIRLAVWTTAANFSGQVKKQLGEIINGLSGL